MSFKQFCDSNGYRAEDRKNPDNLEFKAAKKAWFKQQEKIERLENKIQVFKAAFRSL
jgi:hypothetical protein